MLSHGSLGNLKRVEVEGPASDQGSSGNIDLDVKCESDDSIVDQHGERNMSLLGMSANCVNSVIGAGVLSLSYAIAQVGWVSGVICLFFGGALVWWGLHLLCRVAVRMGGDDLTFGKVAAQFGIGWSLVSEFLVIMNCVVMSIAYLSTAGVFMLQAVKPFASANTNGFILTQDFYVILAFCIAGPLTYAKKLSILQYTSMVAVVLVVYTTILVVVYATKPLDEVCAGFLETNGLSDCFGDKCCASANSTNCCLGTSQLFTSDGLSFISAFPILLTSFTCAAQLFGLYNSLRNPTQKRLDIGTSSALSLCLVLYLILGLAGYFTYGSTISDNLLTSYPQTDIPVTVALLGIGFVLIFSFPLFCCIARDALVYLIRQYLVRGKLSSSKKCEIITFYVVTTALLGLVFAISLLGLDLSFLLNLVGSICVVNISFTLPGVFYWKTFPEEGLSPTRLSCIFLMVFGISLMLMNIALWFI